MCILMGMTEVYNTLISMDEWKGGANPEDTIIRGQNTCLYAILSILQTMSYYQNSF